MLRESVDRALADVDVLVTPCMLRDPWTWRELDELEELIVFGYTAPFSLTSNPALSLPVPSDGLPVALQLVGRRGRDEELFDVAGWAEAALTARSPRRPAIRRRDGRQETPARWRRCRGRSRWLTWVREAGTATADVTSPTGVR